MIQTELRDYQQKAIYDVAVSWRQGYKRPCIVIPCGGGKSVITAEMAKRTTDRGNRVLFLVHRRELCEQIENTFTGWGVNMTLCQVGMVQMIKDFREGRLQILCNVDLISEGFDVPDCGCCILLRPTKSLTLFIQQSMRSMRYVPGKRAVIIDHVGNVHRFGLPDQDRAWSLDSVPHKSTLNQVHIRQCPECYFTHNSAPKCPNCGHIYEKTKEQIMEEKQEAELVKLNRKMQEIHSPDDCKSAKELFALAKKKGYKSGWAYYQAKERGFL